MDFNESIKEVHEVAVAHGWWDTNRDPREVIALMHSELSEALEELRADRPMVWHECDEDHEPCTMEKCNEYMNGHCLANDLGNKPEGIAVELIDCVIRIMDFMGRYDIEYLPKSLRPSYDTSDDPLPILVCMLHSMLSMLFGFGGSGEAGINIDDGKIMDTTVVGWIFSDIIDVIFQWLRNHGASPESIFEEKAAYNKSRPYKHGKQF